MRELLGARIPAASIDETFVCGPDSMADDVRGKLLAQGVADARIHLERFGDPAPRAGAQPVRMKPVAAYARDVTVNVDGKRLRLELAEGGPSLLDVVLKAGGDLPYAYKAGVCCTCRAMLVEGEVRMDANYTLSAEEMRQGFRLTCQSHLVSANAVLDYDQR